MKASYPYHPLNLCMVVGNAVRDIGNGKSDVSKSLLASRLGISEASADFATKLASAKTFGIIEGKSSFSLTSLAKDYYLPTRNPERQKKLCLLKFLQEPGAFARLISQFDGTKPDMEIIANVLHRDMGVPDSWKSRVARFFMRSVEFAGGIDSGGFLRVKAGIQVLEGDDYEDDLSAVDEPQNPFSNPSRTSKSQGGPQGNPREREELPEGTVVWTYPCEGGILRIETPEKLTKEAWAKLKRYIDVLEP